MKHTFLLALGDDRAGPLDPTALWAAGRDHLLPAEGDVVKPIDLAPAAPVVKKKGAHGTLYHYEIEYADPDPTSPTFRLRVWAYDLAHAEERFYEGDDGFEIVRIARMTDRPRHRWNWHKA